MGYRVRINMAVIIFLININRDKFFLSTADWTGGKKGNNIMLNKD